MIMGEETEFQSVSVRGLTEYLQVVIEEDPQLRQVWVVGEVSSINAHGSGLFLTLQDPEGDVTLQCVVWRSQLLKLIETPQLGQQILVLGSVRLYPKRGDYKLMIYQAISVGEGLQSLKHQQLRSRLQAEGLFDPTQKSPLPSFPKTMAVITSPQAAAWGDIQQTFRQQGWGLRVLLAPVIVQGENAPKSILSAIQRVNQDTRAEIILLARGGGASEDLSCFNDERVVRAIAESKIPIVTGIGHEKDQSLADLVADACFHTPTAAAQAIVPNYHQLVLDYLSLQEQLTDALQWRLLKEHEKLHNLKARLKYLLKAGKSLVSANYRCQLLSQKLLALDPENVLKRGYALVKKTDDSIVHSRDEIAFDQPLMIQLKDGILKVKVIE